MVGPSADFLDRIGMFGDPVADPAATLVRGNARITVLTDRLVRLEWAAESHFEDRASYAFPIRRAPVPEFQVEEQSRWTVLSTSGLRLRYRDDGQPFHPGNLAIEVRSLPDALWIPGLRDRRNLGGARRTVDTCRGAAALEPGLVSRSGWAVHDDSASMLFGPDGWALGRDSDDSIDWYFFGYGHDYPAAVADYVRFGGRPGLIPRWMLGAWWSRYWPYRDAELRELVEQFRRRDLPLDVLVIDMDWHLPDSWTGYTWNRELFPDPAAFLRWLHERGLHATLNLHPALGVQPFEDAYADFAQAMQLDPGAGEPVPFHVGDQAFMQNYFELLHHPLEEQGVDFWWMDWQQGRSFGPADIDPLPWLNHLHFTDLSRHGDRRPVTFSRWGGLGSHRYPIGFSGDAFARWEALRFQPRYTAAGANVGYGWWSHDIGGHVGPDDPELYVRWVQFGALSPILRLHSNQDPRSERRPWQFTDEVLVAAREAFHQRYQLIPYLYTAARVAADTGLAPIRPMCWLAPEQHSAYAARYQYQLGESLIVAPVLQAADPATGLAPVDVWLPAGEWIERTTLERVTGPCWLRQVADLRRLPQFVRAGAVLPLSPVAATTAEQPTDHLILSVFPGGEDRIRIYQDDGFSSAHAAGEHSWTTVTTSSPDPSTRQLEVTGEGVAAGRRYTVRLEGTVDPRTVLLDGTPADWQRDGEAIVIEIPPQTTSDPISLVVSADGPLSALTPQRDRSLRLADVRRVLGAGAVTDEQLGDLLAALGPDAPARCAAIARLGGPAIAVDEHTTPDDAAEVLGRVVVGIAPGERVLVTCDWSLDRGGERRQYPGEAVQVPADGLVLDAPFRWDDSLTPTRWSVQVRAVWHSPWGELLVEHRQHSAVLTAGLPSWAVAVTGPEAQPSEHGWRLYQADPFDIDFAELTQRYVVPLQHDPAYRQDEPYLVHAGTELTVARDCTVAFEHHSSDQVEFLVDGRRLDPDVTGGAPSLFYDLAQAPRRTAAVRLAAGKHELLIRSHKDPALPWYQWCLSVAVVDAESGDVELGVTADAAPLLR